jgi:hypothetical protein
MRRTDDNVSRVVYKMTVHGKGAPLNAVCEQREWDEMELARPRYRTLVRAHITDENEAEMLARGTSGDVKVRHSRLEAPVALSPVDEVLLPEAVQRRAYLIGVPDVHADFPFQLLPRLQCHRRFSAPTGDPRR